MGRRLHLGLVMLASCGRIAFDPAGEGPSSDAAIDAIDGSDAIVAVDCAVAPDGTSCDDRNVCTPASRCRSAACVPETPESSCTLARSDTDFDDVQGSKGWWYGFWEAQGDPQYEPADFVEGVWGTDSFVPASDPDPFIYLAWWGTHPNASPLRHTIRRWVSNAQGPAVVTAVVRKVDTGCGDGVTARLVVDGVQTWAQTLAFDDNVGVTMPASVELELATLVELHVGPNDDDACDTTDSTLTIASP